MPAAVVEDLRDAVSDDARRSDFESGFLPLAGKTDRIIPARVMPIDVEQLDGIRELAVVAVKMKTMLDLLPPQRHRFFAIGHARLDRPGNDGVEIAEVVSAVGEPGI